ncbi:hypothetical protein GCM10022393_37430 [Aquimarina addita]|uniref:Fibronectin type-III domain-containing protein n=2 Tax=Aquimarina addita TaxID=870485 RepID=A0ABP6URN6_9FLAO
MPTNYQLFNLNKDLLISILKKSAPRDSQKKTTTIIDLPVEGGMLQKFSVQEASTLDKDLAKRFVDIKSYVAHGIDDPTSVARFSISQIGLHAMISSGNHATIFIDPYTKDKKEYICYAKKDVPSDPNSFECLVEEQVKKEIPQNPSRNFRNANDGKLRTFRLALVCTGEYAQFHLENQSIAPDASDEIKKATVLAAMNTTMTRVNGVFERDLALTMVIINQTTEMIFFDPATDGLTNNDATNLINESQTTCDNIAGFNNYDIGHTFSTGGGGLASLRSPCTTSKARGITGSSRPIGDSYDIDYVAHEIGHQYGGNHTQNNRCNQSNASVEPGSASTIMGYAGICTPNVQNNSDAYFHAISIEEMWNNISGGRSTCGEESNTNNTAPTANAGANFTIPASTPFILKGTGTDSNSDNILTYCWEQMDNESADMPPSANSTVGPTFRSISPTASPDRYMPALPTVIAGATSSTWEVVPSVSRTMNFRLTVRDNSPGGASTASDDTEITVSENAGPFIVMVPNTNINWAAGSTQSITWDVAGTTANGIDVENVDILLSTDGGNTYPTTIASAVANDGSQNITVPNLVGTQNRIMVRGTNHIFYDISNTNFIITSGSGDDTELPTAPTTLTASNITETTVDLSWNAATDNVGVTAYDIYQGSIVIETIVANTSFQITDLSPDTTYNFSVTAKDDAGNESDASNIVMINTLPEISPDTEMPAAPTMLTASNITQTTVDLSWNAATDNVSVTAYDIYQGGIVIETIVANTSFPVIDLSPDSTYNFRVTAKDAAGNESDASNIVTITTFPEISSVTCTEVDLLINLDNYPEETSWSLENNGDIVATGGTYELEGDSTSITVTECLFPGTYTFTLNDSFGDGICCGYGNGTYTLTSLETILASGGTFGNYESTTFTITDPVKVPVIDNSTTTDQSKILVFPNPLQSADILNVVAFKENTVYAIFDMLGRIVMTGKLTNKSINTSGLLSGSYILKLEISSKDKARSIQFIK